MADWIQSFINNLLKLRRDKSIHFIESSSSYKGNNLVLFGRRRLLLWFKIFFTIFICVLFYNFHIQAGKIFYQIFLFFKLGEIFKLKLPGEQEFLLISAILFGCIALLYGQFFIRKDIESMLSMLAVDRNSKTCFYVRRSLFLRRLMIIERKDITGLEITDSLLGRIFKYGHLSIRFHNGETVHFKSLLKIHDALQILTR